MGEEWGGETRKRVLLKTWVLAKKGQDKKSLGEEKKRKVKSETRWNFGLEVPRAIEAKSLNRGAGDCWNKNEGKGGNSQKP